jgi:hypothetical protein
MNPYPTLMEEINGMKNVRRTGPEDVKHPSNISLQGCQKRSSSQSTHFRRCPAFRAISPCFISTSSPPVPQRVERLSSPSGLRASHPSSACVVSWNGLITKKAQTPLLGRDRPSGIAGTDDRRRCHPSPDRDSALSLWFLPEDPNSKFSPQQNLVVFGCFQLAFLAVMEGIVDHSP